MNRRIALWMIVLAIFAAAAVPAYALPEPMGEKEEKIAGQDEMMVKGEEPPMPKPEKMPPMHKMPGMMPGMCPMCHMMMKSVIDKTMLLSPDGGVVVLAGNKLMKFDADLNLVKEAEVKIDVEGLMQDMKGKCPVCKKMASMEERP